MKLKDLPAVILQAHIPYLLVFICLASLIVFVAYVEWSAHVR